MSHPGGEPLNSGALDAFVAAVDYGSITAAADALDLTQSAATKRVRSLERRLGVTLLERGRFGVAATDAGRMLYPEARRALSALHAAAAVVGNHAHRAPTLRLAASHTIGGFLLPAWLSALRRAHPGTRTQVEIVNSRAVLSSVRYEEVDLGFIESLHPGDELTAEGLDTLTVMHDEIAVVVAAGHRWAGRRSMPARMLLQEPYLSREPGSGTRAVAAQRLAAAGIELTPAVETASTQSLKRAVLDGGFTLISRLTIEAELLAGTLVAIPVGDVDLTRPLRAVRRSRRAPTQDASALWAQLAALAAG